MDAPGNWLANYKRALKQNWRQSIAPGILFSLLLGFYGFMLMTFWWASRLPSLGTVAIYLFGLLLLTMFFSLYWPQIALFEQSGKQRFQNCLLFIIRFFWKTLGCAMLQLLYWASRRLRNTASCIQDNAGPATAPPMIHAGIRTKMLEDRKESRTPKARGKNPSRVSRFTAKNDLKSRPSSSQ